MRRHLELVDAPRMALVAFNLYGVVCRVPRALEFVLEPVQYARTCWRTASSAITSLLPFIALI